MTAPASDMLLQSLKRWSEQGWLRRLDSAFAGFARELDPAAPPAVVMAAALVAHMEGRGHACLMLDELLGDADGLLSWPPEAAAELHAVMADLPCTASEWIDALRASPLAWIDADSSEAPGHARNQPLVMRGSRLYLRRYWGYERRVAAQVLRRAAMSMAASETTLRERLDMLFPARPADTSPADIDWQKVACAIALRGQLSIITGGPGTGKTYTAARLLALLFAVDPAPERLRVMLAAPETA